MEEVAEAYATQPRNLADIARRTDEKLLKHAESCTPAKDEIVKSHGKHQRLPSTQLMKFASNTSATAPLKSSEQPQSQLEKLEPDRIEPVPPLSKQISESGMNSSRPQFGNKQEPD